LGDLDFFLQVFSVGGGGISGSFIVVSDFGKIANIGSMNLFVGSVNFIRFVLSINIGLFKRSEEI
jgi:hypothetical protein